MLRGCGFLWGKAIFFKKLLRDVEKIFIPGIKGGNTAKVIHPYPQVSLIGQIFRRIFTFYTEAFLSLCTGLSTGTEVGFKNVAKFDIRWLIFYRHWGSLAYFFF